MNNFWDQSQIYQCGEYQNNQRIGKWNNIYKSVEIGGGQYYIQNGFEIKQGKWIELSHQFWEYGQVIYEGEYEKNKKIGLWNIYYKINQKEKYELIGGGIYDSTKGENIKIGKWFELSDQFWNKKQIFYEGLYNENGIKVGRWNIYFKDQDLNYKKILTGGGEYINHNEVSEIKIGRWIELSDGFYQFQNKLEVAKLLTMDSIKMVKNLEDGISYLTGNKLEVDHTMIHKIAITNQENGQSYLKIFVTWVKLLIQGNIEMVRKLVDGILFIKDIGVKIMKKQGMDNMTVEKVEKESKQEDGQNQVMTFIIIVRSLIMENINKVKNLVDGIYHIKDNKCKFFEDILNKLNYFSGGGSYDDSQGNNYKKGKWIDLSNRFRDVSQVSYVGEYQNGIKVGRWDIYFKNDDTKQNQIIGGGIYDSKEIKGKIGNWVEPNEGFWMQIISSDLTQLFQYFRYNQAIFKGEYKNGKKVGKWLTIFKGEQMQKFIIFKLKIIVVVVYMMIKMEKKQENGLNQMINLESI
ncbi:unnamed protein product [Paramecium sonneborni]|uniref:Uncharacterized protein n=1 Tax=Paramecium sonneborni TaxID=65129 RepID=A0A8S1QNH5_9CILI|nr:unnamed protein product [Paramecium sonneborni]